MLTNNFIKPFLNIQFFGKTRFWTGLALGLGYTFFLYCFFNMLSVGLSYFISFESTGYFLMSESETQFKNFMFAFASCLMGQYYFFEFTLFRNRKFRQPLNIKFRIFHHIRIACWYTLFVGFDWITSIRLIGFDSIFVIFKFWEIGWFVNILILIWLHFYVWSNFSLYFKNIFQLAGKVFLAFVLISFLLSRYDPVPYSESFRNVVKIFPHYQLKIDIPSFPEKDAANKMVHKSLVNTIFVGDPEDDGILNYAERWGNQFTFEELSLLLENFKAKIPERRRNLIIYSLIIDKDIKMKNVYPLLDELRKNGQFKISLSGLYVSENRPDIFYSSLNKGLLFQLPWKCGDTPKIVAYLKRNPDLTNDFLTQVEEESFECWSIDFLATNSPHKKLIKISEHNEIFLEQEIIQPHAFCEKLQTILKDEKGKATTFLNVHPNATYENYFFIKNEIKRAYYEVRNEQTLIRFGKSFEFIGKEKQKAIRADFPMILIEPLNEEERFISDFFQQKK